MDLSGNLELVSVSTMLTPATVRKAPLAPYRHPSSMVWCVFIHDPRVEGAHMLNIPSSCRAPLTADCSSSATDFFFPDIVRDVDSAEEVPSALTRYDLDVDVNGFTDDIGYRRSRPETRCTIPTENRTFPPREGEDEDEGEGEGGDAKHVQPRLAVFEGLSKGKGNGMPKSSTPVLIASSCDGESNADGSTTRLSSGRYSSQSPPPPPSSSSSWPAPSSSSSSSSPPSSSTYLQPARELPSNPEKEQEYGRSNAGTGRHGYGSSYLASNSSSTSDATSYFSAVEAPESCADNEDVDAEGSTLQSISLLAMPTSSTTRGAGPGADHQSRSISPHSTHRYGSAYRPRNQARQPRRDHTNPTSIEEAQPSDPTYSTSSFNLYVSPLDTIGSNPRTHDPFSAEGMSMNMSMRKSTSSPTIAKTTLTSSKFGIATATDKLHQAQQHVLDLTWPSSGTGLTDTDPHHHGVGAEGINAPQVTVAGGFGSNRSSGNSIVRHLYQLQQLQQRHQHHQHPYQTSHGDGTV
eukprot:g14912.t1